MLHVILFSTDVFTVYIFTEIGIKKKLTIWLNGLQLYSSVSLLHQGWKSRFYSDCNLAEVKNKILNYSSKLPISGYPAEYLESG